MFFLLDAESIIRDASAWLQAFCSSKSSRNRRQLHDFHDVNVLDRDRDYEVVARGSHDPS